MNRRRFLEGVAGASALVEAADRADHAGESEETTDSAPTELTTFVEFYDPPEQVTGRLSATGDGWRDDVDSPRVYMTVAAGPLRVQPGLTAAEARAFAQELLDEAAKAEAEFQEEGDDR